MTKGSFHFIRLPMGGVFFRNFECVFDAHEKVNDHTPLLVESNKSCIFIGYFTYNVNAASGHGTLVR